MHVTTISIRFASIQKIWDFKNDIRLNCFYLCVATFTITFEVPEDDMKWAITKYGGKVVEENEKA